MASTLLSLSEDKALDDRKRQFEKERARFYRFAVNDEPVFKETFLEHPFLDSALRKGPPPLGDTAP
jgi:hypothetical protein